MGGGGAAPTPGPLRDLKWDAPRRRGRPQRLVGRVGAGRGDSYDKWWRAVQMLLNAFAIPLAQLHHDVEEVHGVELDLITEEVRVVEPVDVLVTCLPNPAASAAVLETEFAALKEKDAALKEALADARGGASKSVSELAREMADKIACIEGKQKDWSGEIVQLEAEVRRLKAEASERR